LGYVAYCTISGAVEWYVLMGTLILLMFDVVFARLRGEYTAYGALGQDTWPPMGNSNQAWLSLASRGYPPAMIWWDARLTSGLTTYSGASQVYFWGPTAGVGFPMGTMMESFKLAEVTNTDKKGLVIAALIGPIIGMSVGFVALRLAQKYFQFGVTIGHVNTWQVIESDVFGTAGQVYGYDEEVNGVLVDPGEVFNRLPGAGVLPEGFNEAMLMTIFASAALAFVLLIVQRRFTTPGLSSLGWGFAIASIGTQSNFGGGIYYAFFPMIISLLLKWFINRTYGAKAIEDKIIPMSVGMIIMTALVVIGDDLLACFAGPYGYGS